MPENLCIWKRADSFDQQRRVAAGTVNEISQTIAAQFTKCRVDRKSSRSARPLGVPVDLIPRIIIMNEEACAMGNGRLVCIAIRYV
jgi:hypothetical protein